MQLGFVAQDNFLRPDAYDEFIDFRAQKIAEQLNEFLGFGERR